MADKIHFEDENKLEIREIFIEDKDRYLDLLTQLIHVNKKVSLDEFTNKLLSIKQQGCNIFMILYSNEIVGTGKIIIETKIYDSVGHIEDIVIDSKYRHKKLGVKMVNFLYEYGKKLGCYKIVLNCKESLENFYTKCEFTKEGLQMVKRYKL